MTENDELQRAVGLIKAGDKAAGGAILKGLLKQNRDNAQAWLWLSACFEKDEDRVFCLEQVLRINPDHQAARRALEKIKQPESSQPVFTTPVYTPANLYSPPEAKPASVSYTPQTTPPAQNNPQPAATVDFMARSVSSTGDWRRRSYKERPWYRSTWAYILWFLICTPLWAGLLLTDEDVPTVSKVIAGVLVAVDLLCYGSGIFYAIYRNIPPSGPHVVEYRIEGSATTASILYNDGSNNLLKYNSTNARPPWSLTYHMPSNSHPILIAQNQSGSGTVSCTIVVDGKVISRHADYTTAQCSVAIP